MSPCLDMGYSIARSSDKHTEIHVTEAKNGRCVDVEVCCSLCAVTCDPGLNQPVVPGVCDDMSPMFKTNRLCLGSP